MSSCKFPNHLSPLRHAKGKHSSLALQQEHNTHCLSHIHVLIDLASLQEEPFQSQMTESHPGLWPSSPWAHFSFKTETSECTAKLMRWPVSCSHPSLPARCTVSDASISRYTNQGNKTKTWHGQCVTAEDTTPLSAVSAARSPGIERRNAGYGEGVWG